MLPFEDSLRWIETIPGAGRRTAEVLLAEIGPDVSRPQPTLPLGQA